MKFECLDEFLSIKMEEKTCLEQHLKKMYEIHQRLVHVWDYWMADEFAIDGVLRSLPPSFKNYVRGYVMERDSITFCEFISRFRTVKAEPIVGKVIDAKGIFDIRVINVYVPFALVAVF